MKALLSSLALLWVAPVIATATNYETSFESPGFGTGEVHQQSGWSAGYSTDPTHCTIVDASEAPLAPPDGVQMLQLVRPDVESHPAAGIIFHEVSEPLLEFTVEFRLAYLAQTDFGIFRFAIGSAADSASGVQAGIAFIDEGDGVRKPKIVHSKSKAYTGVPMPGSRDARPAEALTFYDFTLRVHDSGRLYDLTVRQGDEVVATVANQSVAILPNTYNRLIVSIPGGSRGDQLFFDALKISP